MTPKPIELLKKGLTILKNRVATRKASLLARLADSKSITSEDGRWLDGEANLVDEDVAIDKLAKASDFESTLSELSEPQQAAVARLRKIGEEAEGQGVTLSGKRKRTSDAVT